MNKFLNQYLKNTSLIESISILLISNITMSLVLLETKKLPFMSVIHKLCAILVLYIWIKEVIRNGKHRKAGFLVVLGITQLLPYFVAMQYTSYATKRIYVEWLDILKNVLNFICIKPWYFETQYCWEHFSANIYTVMTFLLMVFVSIYMVAYASSKRGESNG